jgi:hypothetical protein
MPKVSVRIAAKQIMEKFPARILQTWLQEFGYTQPDALTGLEAAVIERGSRLVRELRIHGQRLAERAQMDGRRVVTGESSVIR